MDKQAIAAEALARATQGESWSNYPAIYAGFAAKGIAEADIKPRENVFTYNAWRALGRQVRRGEHGVRVETVIHGTKEDKETGEQKVISFPRSTTVFHITQTDPIGEKPRWRAPEREAPAAAPYVLKPEPKPEPVVYKSPVTNRELSEEDLDREYRKLFPSKGGEV